MREYYKNITYFDSDYNGKSILKKPPVWLAVFF